MWLPFTTLSLLLLVLTLEVEANRQRNKNKNAHTNLNRHRPSRDQRTGVQISGNIVGHNPARSKQGKRNAEKDDGDHFIRNHPKPKSLRRKHPVHKNKHNNNKNKRNPLGQPKNNGNPLGQPLGQEKPNKDTTINPNAKVLRVQLSNYYDVIYKGHVSVGTPEQKFEVLFDTGAAKTWFPVADCHSEGDHPEACTTNGHQTYDPTKSSTHTKLNPFKFYRYGTNYHGHGVDYSDVIKIGQTDQVQLKNYRFGAVKNVSEYAGGVIGLGVLSGEKTFFEEAYKQGLFPEPVFTMHLKACGAQGECSDGGFVDFGSAYPEECEKEIELANVTRDTSLWKFELGRISFGVGKKRVENSFVQWASSIGPHLAIVDSGNSYLHLPPQFIEDMKKRLDVKKNGRFYTAPCEAKVSMDIMVNKQLFVLSEKELLLEQGFPDGRCVLAITDNKTSKDLIVLGMPVYRALCISHYTKERQLGFARPKKH